MFALTTKKTGSCPYCVTSCEVRAALAAPTVISPPSFRRSKLKRPPWRSTMTDLNSWLPADLEQRLLDPTDGPAILEAYAVARRRHDRDELHPLKQWRFVVNWFDRLTGPPADPCCCCSRSTDHRIGNIAANQSVTAITSLDRHCTHAKADGVPGDPPPSNDLCHEGHWASVHAAWLLSHRGSRDRCHRTGGLHRRQPVLSMVSQASIALCRSIRRRVRGTGGRGGTQV